MSSPEFIPIDIEAASILDPYLLPGETLIWCARPLNKSFFQLYGKVLIGLLVAACLVQLLAFSIVFSHSDSAPQQIAPPSPQPHSAPEAHPVGVFFFTFFIFGFTALWLFLFFKTIGGDAVLHRFRFRNAYYGLTSMRLLQVTTGQKKSLLALSLRDLPNFVLEEDSNGEGTIVFSQPPRFPQASLFSREAPQFIFRHLSQSNQVFGLILKTQAELLHRDHSAS